MKIDLAYFFSDTATHVNWSLGEKRAIALPLKHLSFTVDCLLKQTTADWILFWDYSLGEPNIRLIQELASKPVDAWHAGLKLGLSHVPSIINYVDPTWIYNKNADINVEHSSFRLSIGCCLIRVEALKTIGSIPTEYSSLDAAGVALGYQLLKQGGIVRYHPGLTITKVVNVNIPEIDEWTFLRQFYPKKWQIWVLLNKKGLFNNYRLWRRTRSIAKINCIPRIHPSVKTTQRPESAKVSVLIPTLDRYHYLINEIEQLAHQTILPHEILITDQTNEEKRIKLDTSAYPSLTIKYFPQNEKGQCVAWNKLLEEATGDYVLFLGDDADGIAPDFIEKLLQTQSACNCDMVASHVVELGIPPASIPPYYYMSTTFPITLIKRSVLLKTGFMDMFYNKNVRADHDLAMRCHAEGALMIYDPSATIYHHRAPSGGLRAHKARVITNFMSKNSIRKFATPTSSEIYLVKKYFDSLQYKNYIRISYFNQLVIRGNVIKKLIRGLIFIIKSPQLVSDYHKNKFLAEQELKKHDKKNT